MKKRFLILQKKLFVLFVIFVFTFLPIAPALTEIHVASAQNNFSNTPNFTQWTRTPGNLNQTATPGSTTTIPGSTTVVPGVSSQNQWTTQPDFNQGANVNTSNTTSPGDVVLTPGAAAGDFVDTTVPQFNAGNSNPNNDITTSTAISEPGDVSLYITEPSSTTIFTPEPCGGGEGGECNRGLFSGALDSDNQLLYTGTATRNLTVTNTNNTPLNTADDTETTYPGLLLPHPIAPIANDQVNNTTIDATNNLLYMSTQAGLTVMNTQGTISPADDTVLTTYSTLSTPALASDIIFNTTIDTVNHLLYISTDAGLSVINTQNTLTPADDTLVITYSTLSTPALPNDTVKNTTLDLPNHLVYADTGGGLTVIDTNNTVTASDDILIGTDNVYREAVTGYIFAIDDTNGLVYTRTSTGLGVIDTKNNADSSDDVFITTYEAPSMLASTYVRHVSIDTVHHLLYVSTDGSSGPYIGGLTVIDTQGTIDPTDDIRVGLYQTTDGLNADDVVSTSLDTANNVVYVNQYHSTSYWSAIHTQGTLTQSDDIIENSLVSNNIATPDLVNDLIYITSTSDGVTVMNRNGTATITDDTIAGYYTTGSPAPLPDNNAYGIAFNPALNTVYVQSLAGVTVIDTNGTTTDLTDDIILTTYASFNTPTFDTAHNLLYFGSGSGLVVINNNGTTALGDDTTTMTYTTASSPAITDDALLNSPVVDTVNHLVYVSTSSGPSVIDTKNSITPTDDTSIVDYSVLYTIYTTAGINQSTLDTVHNLVYVSTDSGVYVINTQATDTPNDDTLVTIYDDASTPAIVPAWNRYVYGTTLDTANNLVYINTSAGGLVVINMQGTVTPSDDTLFETYSPWTILSDTVLSTTLDTVNGFIYVSTPFGLSIIDTNGTPLIPGDDMPFAGYDYDTSPIYLGSGPSTDASVNSVTIDTVNNLVYANTTSGGIAVINIQDEVLITTYTALQYKAPKGYDVALDNVNHIVYSSFSGGVLALNTYNNNNPSDDVVIAAYTLRGSSVSIPEIDITDIDFVEATHLLYISTLNNLTVIDTQNTLTPDDDTVVATYNNASTPATPDAIISTTIDGDLLYISTYAGLSVINTQGTLTQSDDALVITYDMLSTPAIAWSTVNSSSIDTVNHLLYISTDNGGLSVIDTKGTLTATDDELVTTYTDLTTPSIGSYNVNSTLIDTTNHLIYVSTYYGGLSVINTQGTIDPIDDTSVTYDIGTALSLPHDRVWSAFFNTPNINQVYIVTFNGLTLLDTIGGDHTPSGEYISSIQPIATTPTEALSFSATQTADHTTSLSYRTGTIGGDWVDNFDDNSTSEFSMNPYGWSDYFQTATESSGTMKISNPVPYVDGLNSVSDAFIDTGQIFPTGSTITARIRINSNTRIAQDWTNSLFTNNLNDVTNLGFLPNNVWQTVTLTSATSFSTIGFEITYQTDSWDAINDSLEIDSITITSGQNLTETIVGNAFANAGTAQGWNADDASWGYTLPFDFTFYGVTYAAGQTIQIGSNGIICLNNTLGCATLYGNFGSDISNTTDGPIIAPLNINLLTNENPGDDIYLTEDPNFITFRWQAVDWNDSNPINFEATLYKNGDIKFNYGDQPFAPATGSAMVGINSSDGTNYAGSAYNGSDTFHQYSSSFWSPSITWDAWSTPCTTSPCAINQADLTGKTSIQYKLALTTSNSLTTPVVHDVTYSSDYARTGTFTSQNVTFPAGNRLTSFVADIAVPDNTSLAFEYSIDGGATWTSLASNYTFPSNFTATQFQWRATFTSSNIVNIPNIHGVVLSSTLPDTTTTTPDTTITTAAVNPPDRVSKVTLDQKKLKTGNDINYTETCTPLLEGKYTDAKNGEVFLYQLRDTGSKDKIKNDSIDSKGEFALRIPTIDTMQTYYLRLTDSNGDESALSKPFIISCIQPMPLYTPPLEESSEIMLPNIRHEIPPTIIIQDEPVTPVIASVAPEEIDNSHPFLSALLSIGGLLAGTALFGGLLAFLPLFSAIPSALQGGLLSVLPIGTFFTSKKGRKNWGIVFDTQTKQAIPNVRLSLVNERGGVLDTINTDQYGRYGLLTTPGTYTITINKGAYKLLTTQTTDPVYGDIYHGQKMTINSMGEIVALNIALDPGSVNWKAFAQSMVTRSASLSRAIILDLFYILYGAGGIFTLTMAYLHKGALNITLAVLYVLLFGVFIYQSMIKGKSFGTLKDKKTSTPIAFAQVALHTLVDPHRAAFAVTDPIGRYYLLADNGRYNVKVGGQFENRVFNEETPVHVNDGTLRTDFIV